MKRKKQVMAAKSRWDKEKVGKKRICERNAPTPTPLPSPTTGSKESIEIPFFIDSDTWMDFVKHRGGSKFTRLMATRIIKQLIEWNEKGHDVNDILNRSIMNGWKGVFEPDNKKGKTNGDPKEELARFLDKRAGKETG